ncbi:hypothetical protein QBC40DRAFT_256027 [Triangularia verruculosa]|uniref:Uncharacterized protein n=1 Tax=Triangularia verruculosa TaxID=2587418 RepID=A0AAN6XDG3_9PEZI|nr:hypothetical protein QBC40DRAFT_256027 [Triangularia verruculosa]
MKYTTALLALVASASAIDLYLHGNNDCGGSELRCNNRNPNTCCGTNASTPYRSVAVRGIPSGWSLQGRGYDQGNCNRLQTISGNNGNLWICNRSNNFFYTGVGYNFVSRKRNGVDVPVGVVAKDVKEECQRPDALVLEDGTEYDLTSLNEENFDSLVTIGFNASSSADIPEHFQSLQIN